MKESEVTCTYQNAETRKGGGGGKGERGTNLD